MVNISDLTEGSKWWVKDINGRVPHVATIKNINSETSIIVKWDNGTTTSVPIYNIEKSITDTGRRTRTKTNRYVEDPKIVTPECKRPIKKQKITKQSIDQDVAASNPTTNLLLDFNNTKKKNTKTNINNKKKNNKNKDNSHNNNNEKETTNIIVKHYTKNKSLINMNNNNNNEMDTDDKKKKNNNNKNNNNNKMKTKKKNNNNSINKSNNSTTKIANLYNKNKCLIDMNNNNNNNEIMDTDDDGDDNISYNTDTFISHDDMEYANEDDDDEYFGISDEDDDDDEEDDEEDYDDYNDAKEIIDSDFLDGIEFNDDDDEEEEEYDDEEDEDEDEDDDDNVSSEDDDDDSVDDMDIDDDDDNYNVKNKTKLISNSINKNKQDDHNHNKNNNNKDKYSKDITMTETDHGNKEHCHNNNNNNKDDDSKEITMTETDHGNKDNRKCSENDNDGDNIVSDENDELANDNNNNCHEKKQNESMNICVDDDDSNDDSFNKAASRDDLHVNNKNNNVAGNVVEESKSKNNNSNGVDNTVNNSQGRNKQKNDNRDGEDDDHDIMFPKDDSDDNSHIKNNNQNNYRNTKDDNNSKNNQSDSSNDVINVNRKSKNKNDIDGDDDDDILFGKIDSDKDSCANRNNNNNNDHSNPSTKAENKNKKNNIDDSINGNNDKRSKDITNNNVDIKNDDDDDHLFGKVDSDDESYCNNHNNDQSNPSGEEIGRMKNKNVDNLNYVSYSISKHKTKNDFEYNDADDDDDDLFGKNDDDDEDDESNDDDHLFSKVENDDESDFNGNNNNQNIPTSKEEKKKKNPFIDNSKNVNDAKSQNKGKHNIDQDENDEDDVLFGKVGSDDYDDESYFNKTNKSKSNCSAEVESKKGKSNIDNSNIVSNAISKKKTKNNVDDDNEDDDLFGKDDESDAECKYNNNNKNNCSAGDGIESKNNKIDYTTNVNDASGKNKNSNDIVDDEDDDLFGKDESDDDSFFNNNNQIQNGEVKNNKADSAINGNNMESDLKNQNISSKNLCTENSSNHDGNDLLNEVKDNKYSSFNKSINNDDTNNDDNVSGKENTDVLYNKIKVGTNIKKFFPEPYDDWYDGTIQQIFVKNQSCKIYYKRDHTFEYVSIDSLMDPKVVKILDDGRDFNCKEITDFDYSRCVFFASIPQGIKNLPKPANNIQTEETIEIIQIEEPTKDQYFLKCLFRKILIVKRNVNERKQFETLLTRNGDKYHLLLSKFQKTNGQQNSKFVWYQGSDKFVKAYYVASEHYSILLKELNRLGDFYCQEPCKIASRLELMVSTAAWAPRKKYALQFTFDMDDFEVLKDENFNAGCGFAPPSFFKKHVGFTTKMGVAEAVQVRIFCGGMGWFKGILLKKYDIEKIQLPPSMLKVGKSRRHDRYEWVFLVITKTFPSVENIYMGRYINPGRTKPPEKWPEKNLRNLYDSRMYTNLLRLSGVHEELIKNYNFDCREWKGRNHAMLLGVADPTDQIPKGMVFLTGMGTTEAESVNTLSVLKIAVTRFPCTEKNDMVILDCIRSKPSNMSDKKWAHLQSYNFGMIVFGPPLEGDKPIPQSIADGDLDGDLYMCLWDFFIVDSIRESKEANESASSLRESKEVNDQTASRSGDVNSTENTEEADPFLHFRFQHTVDNVVYQAYVSKKVDNIWYEVKLSNAKILQSNVKILQMSADQILQGRGVVEKILSHKGKIPQVLIKWKNLTEPSWQSAASLRETNKQQLIDYAIQNDLVNTIGWKWTKKYLSDTDMIEVVDHVGKGSQTTVVVRYDDGSFDEKLLTEMKVDAKDLLAKYCKSKGLEKEEAWMWVPSYIKNAEKRWLARTQRIVCDVQRFFDFDRLTTHLYTKYKQCYNAWRIGAMIAFGKAVKESVDMRKHGGKVHLPIHLHPEVNVGRLRKYLLPCELSDKKEPRSQQIT